VEDAGTYVCEAVGYANYIPGQHVTVNLNVERCEYESEFKWVLSLEFLRVKDILNSVQAAWGEHKYEELRSNRIRYGTVPHIDLEFFGLGRAI